MPKSFSQYDQGAGSKYASKPKAKAKKSANPNPTAPKPTSEGRRRASELNNMGRRVMGDMRRHRRDVLRGGN